MKTLKITTLAFLLGAIPSMSFANTETSQQKDIEYDYEEPMEYKYDYNYEKSVRFFVGLNAPLIQHQNTKISAKGYEETTYYVTKINNKIFENTALVFGVDTDFGLRISFLISHNSDETEVANVSTKTKQTNLGFALDIPFAPKRETIPFLRLGVEHTNFEQTDIDMSGSGMGYILGLGVSHNFSKDIFGVLSFSYESASPETKVSGIDLTTKTNAFVIGLGVGYRF